MEIILKGENIHRMFKEIEISNLKHLLANNISILNFLIKCNITYRYINSYNTNDFFNYDDMVLIPSIENYNNLIYKELVKNNLIEENDVLTIKNISNTEEDFFYFKLKYK